MDKKISRIRRSRKARAKIQELECHRLSVHRTPRHIYAQIIAPDSSKTLLSVSTVQADIKAGLSATGNVEAAKKVGSTLADKAKAIGIESVAFDRSGFRYHGRVKALADAAREGGLKF